MNYLFDKRFKFGMIVGVFLFLIWNVLSYRLALKRDYELDQLSGFSGIRFSGNDGFDWGFPFVWGRPYITQWDDGILNVAFCLVLCVVLGTIFKLAKR